MDPRTSLRRRVGDTPLLRSPNLAAKVGLPNLRLKMEGSNPTGTQKDRVARLEVGGAVAQDFPGVSVASCGNFGVAMAHACYVHEIPCHVFVPEDFQGERVETMEGLGAKVHRVPGMYEDAVVASRNHAKREGLYDANPGGVNTLRTLAGYSRIAEEIVAGLGETPAAIGAPIGNGSTLAGVHLGFHMAWAQERAKTVPKVFGGSSSGNNPVPTAVARQQDRISALDPRAIVETHVNEPLVNWDALDGTACLTAIRDSKGFAYGYSDEELLDLHSALLEDGVDAHPASLAAVAALGTAREEGRIEADDVVVAVMTSGRPQVTVERIQQAEAPKELLTELKQWLGRFGDPLNEMDEAVQAAFDRGFVLEARDKTERLGYTILTPMELDVFFPKYHLSYIAVSPAARGRGVGTLLIEEAIRATDGHLSLHVETDNENAIRLYEKFGFERKYYRMLYKGAQTPHVDPAAGSGWKTLEEEESDAPVVTAKN